MTYKQFTDEIATLDAQWATDSNDPTATQERRFELCEAFIVDMRAALVAVGAHPDPPPPRVR